MYAYLHIYIYKSVDEIVYDKISFLVNKFDLEVTEINKNVPNLY